jgi:hypothetical protein
MLNIDCYLSRGSPLEDEFMENILEALSQEGEEAEATVHRVSAREAERLGLRGLPAILINGEDIQPAGTGGPGHGMFKDEAGGLSAVPTVMTLRLAIRKHK